MNTKKLHGFGTALMLSAITLALSGCGDSDDPSPASAPAPSPSLVAGRVAFVGASITDGWDFDGYFPGRDFRKVLHYAPDKTEVWETIAALNARYVVVKECAAYFNTDGGTPIADYQNAITSMVSRIRSVGAVPVLASTIPVDVGAGGCTQAQLQDINTFNTWLRAYCTAQGIVCMDLNTAIADPAGQLPTAFHDGDGLHPNESGYDVLTVVVLPALRAAGYAE